MSTILILLCSLYAHSYSQFTVFQNEPGMAYDLLQPQLHDLEISRLSVAKGLVWVCKALIFRCLLDRCVITLLLLPLEELL